MPVDFTTEYTTAFQTILTETTEDATPYAKTIEFLTAQFDNYNISDEYKAQLQAQLMSNLTVSFTQSAMSTALQLADKGLKIDDEILAKQKQNTILDKQASKLDADTSLVEAQEDAVTQQVIDNRKIKALEQVGGTFEGAMMGGMLVTAEMWQFFFSFASSLGDELLSWKGDWDATTAFNPTTPVKGDFYSVTTDAANVDEETGIINNGVNVDGTSSWSVGEILWFDGGKWTKSIVKLPTNTDMTKAT